MRKAPTLPDKLVKVWELSDDTLKFKQVWIREGHDFSEPKALFCMVMTMKSLKANADIACVQAFFLGRTKREALERRARALMDTIKHHSEKLTKAIDRLGKIRDLLMKQGARK